MLRRMFCLGCVVAVAPGVASADWEFQSNLTASVTHTNNVALDLPNAEQQDSILVLTPTFELTQESSRVNLGLRYNPQAVFYDEFDEADSVFHIFDGDMTAELVKERLFVDVAAAQFQTIVTPEGSFPVNNIPISDNRADSRVISVAPYWVQRFGSTEMRIDAAHIRTDFDDESIGPQTFLQSNNANTGGFRLGSAPKNVGVTWAVDYNYQRVDYENAIPWEYQRAQAQLGFWVSDSFRVFATGGQETAFDDFFTGDLEDSLWEAGMQFAPSPRLNLEIAAGDRSFGSTKRASLTHNTARLQTTLTYAEIPQTQGQLVGGREPLRDTDNLDFLLDRAGDSDRLIQKRGELATTLTLPKSTLTLRVFSERRTNRTTAEGIQLDNDELRGAAIRYDWRFGARTNLTLDLDNADREGPNEDGRLWRAQLGVGYTLSSRVSLRLDLQHVEEDGFAGLSGNPYDADTATLSVSMQL